MENLAINSFFENLLKVSPDFITLSVLIICTVFFIVPFFPKWRDVWRNVSPALMISAGIIGTFWGTFIALSEFKTGDHEKMIESIPDVLDGMKTAFVTSLIGLLFAFASKTFLHILPKPKSEPLPIESDTLELLKQIKDGIAGEKDGSLSSQLSAIRTENRDGMTDLKQSIAGDGDSSIATQLTKLRNENVDWLKKLDAHMEGLAETIRTSLVENMNALMGELRDVIANQLVKQLEETNKVLSQQLEDMIKRIEKALIDQFGTTFEEFNSATQAIKKWQEEHKEHVEQLTEAFKMTATGIEKIRHDCESIPATMKQLEELMGELDERLKAFADMKNTAEQSFPVIKQHLDAIGSNLEKSAEGFNRLEKIISDTYTNANELAQKHIADIETQMNLTAKQVKETVENMIAETGNASIKHQNEIRGIMDKISTESKRCREDTEATLKTLRDEYIKDIGETITGITKSWGNNVKGIGQAMADVLNRNNPR